MAGKINKNRNIMAYHSRSTVDYRAVSVARFANMWSDFRVDHEREIKFRIDLAKLARG